MNMQKQSGFTLTELMIVLVIVVGAVGYISNIVQIVNALSDPITGMFIFRLVGIILFPVGAILGYIPV